MSPPKFSTGVAHEHVRTHHRRIQRRGRHHHAEPAQDAQCALVWRLPRDRGGRRRPRGGRQDQLHRRRRQRESLCRRCRHQGDAAERLHRHVLVRLRRCWRRPHRALPQADHCRRQRLCARRRLRARHDVRHHHRRRHRKIRPARDHARHHSRHRRHPAPDPRRRQVEGDGSLPHRADDGCD